MKTFAADLYYSAGKLLCGILTGEIYKQTVCCVYIQNMDLSEFTEDSSKNVVLKSCIPPSTKLEECMLGIDEAGRGPVLGNFSV